VVRPCLITKSDDPAVDRSQPEPTVLTAVGEEGSPLRRGRVDQLGRGQVGDVHPDQAVRAIAETTFDSARSSDVRTVIVGHKHELGWCTPQGGILVSQPRTNDVERRDMDPLR
jgi:hypothetical protein